MRKCIILVGILYNSLFFWLCGVGISWVYVDSLIECFHLIISCIIGMHINGLAHAASGYRRVLEENRKLYNQVQDLKGDILMCWTTSLCLSSSLIQALN